MNDCIHYWIIDPPLGPISRGICKKCKEERDFENGIWYSDYTGPIPLSMRQVEGIDFKQGVAVG